MTGTERLERGQQREQTLELMKKLAAEALSLEGGGETIRRQELVWDGGLATRQPFSSVTRMEIAMEDIFWKWEVEGPDEGANSCVF